MSTDPTEPRLVRDRPSLADAVDPTTFEVLRHRLWAINDEAAVTITRVSGSPIATEGNDFNAGLTTAEGEIVVAGIYVLVHAGSLGRVVRWILDRYADNPGIRPGDMFITNDTWVGAPHQPDVIVVAPIFDGDRLVAWCGSIVHQADVGGPVPGSITVGAASIYEEAVPMAVMKLVDGGVLRRDVENEYLIRSRTPELNALDMLGQVAANRVQSARILELCARYGTDAVMGTMDRLIDTTEARVRRRLRSLPDGTFRHVGFLEHDGIEDRVYPVRLTMTKQGDALDLDFTASADQAPALINTTHATAANYAMGAVMSLLGWELPWVPAAFERVMTVRTRPGSVVACVHPAGMSMGVTAAGQEVRTAVNLCLDRLFDASTDPEHQRKILAGCPSSSATQTIAGRHADGRRFGAMLLDGLPGGSGARSWADGPDCGGFLSSPSGSATNIETNELHHPQRYLWRRERPDSAGPGRWRGGVGAEHAYVPHHADGPITSTVFAHGLQPPTSSGACGGEPGTQNAFLVARGGGATASAAGTWTDLPGEHVPLPPKQVGELGPDDVYVNWCVGGGGFGDPLDRPPALVVADVADGLVTVAGADRDHAVVVVATGPDPWDVAVDEPATAARREERRRARLGGRDPERAAWSATPAGRRLSLTIELVDGHVGSGPAYRCRSCAVELGPVAGTTAGVKDHLVRGDASVAERWALAAARPGAERFTLRRFWCPGCAVQVDVELALADEPPYCAAELAPAQAEGAPSGPAVSPQNARHEGSA
jgi:N-methylhydantoinase B